ncbi:MAG: GxxExxY protein [Prevotella sp.]|nr:GxxExxY protein [Prevotella sp.]MBR1449938.1 GxxExxY protein [Prevotella sp.]
MDLIQEYNKRLEPMKVITGVAMKVHAKFRSGLLESAYEAAMKYLLEKDRHRVERQKELPIFWDNVQLDQSYRMDLVIDDIIVELKSVSHTNDAHVRQLWNYMHLTHTEYGMLINFGSERLYSAWYRRDPLTREIEKVKLM